MIYEHAAIEVKPNSGPAFEAAVAQAAAIFRRAAGCRSFRLERSVEQPCSYLLVVGWATLEDHVTGFRQSDGFAEWRALASPHFAAPPVVRHVETVLDSILPRVTGTTSAARRIILARHPGRTH